MQWAFLLALSGLGAEPAPEVDQSSPRAALKTYFTALEFADLKVLDRVCIANDVQKEWIAQQAAMMAALRRFGDVGVEQFGDAGRVLQQPSPAAAGRQKAEQIEITLEGDRAQAAFKPKDPLQLARDKDGLWRIDYASTLSGKDEQMKYAAQVFRETAKLVSTLADEIQADKFSTVDEVRKELRDRRRTLDVELAKDKPASLSEPAR